MGESSAVIRISRAESARVVADAVTQSDYYVGNLPDLKGSDFTVSNHPCRELSNRVFAGAPSEVQAARNEFVAAIAEKCPGLTFTTKASMRDGTVQDGYEVRFTAKGRPDMEHLKSVLWKAATDATHISSGDEHLRMVHGQVWMSKNFADNLLYTFSGRAHYSQQLTGVGMPASTYQWTQQAGEASYHSFCKELTEKLTQKNPKHAR